MVFRVDVFNRWTVRNAFTVLALGLLAYTLPARAQSITGAADSLNTLVTQDGQQYDITGGSLSSDGTNLFHSFGQFNLDQGQTANFVSDPAVVNILGRVSGGDASIIDGLIQVSGGDANLFLINPAGILFGENARLNLGGSFTATTADRIGFEEGWFSALDGGVDGGGMPNGTPNLFAFTQGHGGIINEGTLAVQPEQSLTLLGGFVINTGTLQAPSGNISVIAIPEQNTVRIGQTNGLLSLDLQTTSPSAVEATTPLSSTDIPSLLTPTLVSHAVSLEMTDAGDVRLTGGTSTELPLTGGTTVVAGTLDVSGATGGNVTVVGEQVTVAQADIDASGQQGGGSVRIGGDYQGQGALLNAIQTQVQAGTRIIADAIAQGNGGRVIIWADDTTSFHGHISATGGTQSGDGGFAEVSGKRNLMFEGTVDLTAALGDTGTLLLDPDNIRIVDGAPGADDNEVRTDNRVENTDGSGLFVISERALESLTGTADVELQANNHIIMDDLSDDVLKFQRVDGSITFTADADGNGVGDFIMHESDRIETFGNSLTITGVNLVLGTLDTGDFSDRGGGVALKAQGDIIGQSILSGGASRGGHIFIDSDQGDITFEATIRSFARDADGRGGNVTLLAEGDIDLLEIESYGDERGGVISLTSEAGQIEVTGILNSVSENGTAGDVVVRAAGDVVLGRGDTGGGYAVRSEGEFEGGNITIISENGSIDTSQGALVNIARDGVAGNIELIANGDIVLGESDRGLSISSLGADRGGHVDITSHQGSVTALGTIATIAGESVSGSSMIELSTEGAAGNVAITARKHIDLSGSIAGYAIYSAGADRGGMVALTSLAGAISITDGRVSNESPDGTAGAVILQARDDISLVGIESEGLWRGGDIAIESDEGAISVSQNLDSFSAEGRGGSVSLLARGDIETQDVRTFGSEESGDVLIVSDEGSISTVNILTEAPNGSSGNVTLMAAGDITTGDIVAEGLVSGDVDLFSLEGEINTGDIFGYGDDVQPSRDTTQASISRVNFSRATLSADAADVAVVELETERTQAFSDYFETDLQVQELSPAEIQNVLVNVAQSTGTRSAIVYVNAPSVAGDTGLEIVLFTADNNPIRLKTESVTQAELTQTVNRFRRTLVSSVRQGSSTYLTPAQQLYDWLIAPIEAELGEGEFDNLLFSMDAGLRTVPLAALHDGEQFLIEKYSLGTVPAISLMNTDYKSLDNAQMLAMGVSEFEQLSPLPAVPAEIKTITDLWNGVGFLNEEFTRHNLISQRQQIPYEILHLATHAEFKAGTAEDSYIQLWDDRLRLSEVDDLGWKNPAVELLVLSACQTAVGSLEAEMGFAGLSIASGVRTAVASLWSVDDAGTLALMTNFYSQLQGAEVKSEALRQAQLAMIRGDVQIAQGQLRDATTAATISLPSDLEGMSSNDLSHPFYWAGFAMVGNPW